MPRCARPQAGTFSMCSPSNTMVPASAAMVLSIRLNTVDLPDPLGPMSPVIEPRGTVNEQPSTALIPPKCFLSPVTASSGVVSVARLGDGDVLAQRLQAAASLDAGS